MFQYAQKVLHDILNGSGIEATYINKSTFGLWSSDGLIEIELLD